ncbi:hypothetical protein [Phenylobacterium sp.]|uniref:hypothetical protein n=1 Tax=Phenylobacterium sp. TaxID=1871053 RepID=UPI0035AE9E84
METPRSRHSPAGLPLTKTSASVVFVTRILGNESHPANPEAIAADIDAAPSRRRIIAPAPPRGLLMNRIASSPTPIAGLAASRLSSPICIGIPSL